MKRLHVHVSVPDLSAAVKFYGQMFGAEPTVAEADYAKWSLDDPRVNFAISARGAPAGLDHLGIEAETEDELQDVTQRMKQAGEVFDQGQATCCYAESDKAWVRDPQGLAWEAFFTTGRATRYGFEAEATEARIAGSRAAASSSGDLALPSLQPGESCCGPGSTSDGDCGEA